MYEPHKDNLDRIERENRRISAIEQRCQEAIRNILAQEGIEARLTFYPGRRPAMPDTEVADLIHDIERHQNNLASAEKAIDKARTTIEMVVAQLRHAYEQLAAGSVIDQRGLANGLIAPQIEYLESIITARDVDQAAYDRFMEICLNPPPPTQALIDLMRNFSEGVASGRIVKAHSAPKRS